MNVFWWLLIGLLACFIAMGWPAAAIARHPGGPAGLAWLGITFGAPALVWVLVASLRGSDYDSGDLLYFLRYLASVAALTFGTIVARALHGRRRPGRGFRDLSE